MNCTYFDFIATLNTLNSSIRQYKYHLNSKPFSPTQKKLLRAFLLYKKGKANDVINALRGLHVQEKTYDAIRLYILSIAQNHIGSYKLSLMNSESSIKMCQESNNKKFIIFPILAALITLGNRKEAQHMKFYLDKIESYETDDDYIRLSIYQVYAIYYSLIDDFASLNKTVRKALLLNTPYLKELEASFILLNFISFFKQGNYKGCYLTLENYKKSKGFVVRVNYKYMKMLLDHITQGSPLYVYEKDFKGFTELYKQVEVLKSLDCRDLESAKDSWCELQKHNPSLYENDFQYTGDYCLFSNILNSKLEKRKQVQSFNEDVLKSLTSDAEKVLYLLRNSNKSLSKYEIIDTLWNHLEQSRAESKLYKAIHKLKRSDLKVKNKMGCYFIEKKAA